jgi:hypothetical protein
MEAERIWAGYMGREGLPVSWGLHGLLRSVRSSLFLRADSDKAWCGYKRPPLSHPTSSKHGMVLGIGGSSGEFHTTALRSNRAKDAGDIKRLSRVAHEAVADTIHGHIRPHTATHVALRRTRRVSGNKRHGTHGQLAFYPTHAELSMTWVVMASLLC